MTVTDISPAELRALRNRWDKALKRPYKVRVLTPLPLRVRARLVAAGAVDRTAAWLVRRVHWRAGEFLWRVTGACCRAKR